MRFVLAIILLFLLILSLICGVGIGMGFLLHWIIPSIGVDTGTLIGVVSMGWSVYFFTRLMAFGATLENGEREVDWSDIESIVLPPIRLRRPSKRKKTP
ncbi:MAG: hypothetical protein KDK89_09845 [Alphaproteobacteria bacterium]|nr:hypothetical protein [Alphaproteobacteria bacterium]